MSDRTRVRAASPVSVLLAQRAGPVCPRTRDLPRIAVAALEAEAFLTWPSPRIFCGSRS